MLKKQNPEEIKPQIRQSSEFEKKEIIDTNEIAALIDKAKEEEAVKEKNPIKLLKVQKKILSPLVSRFHRKMR